MSRTRPSGGCEFSNMKIAILHHHLNPGGVTQVILNHLRSLNASLAEAGGRCEVAIIFGGRREGIRDAQLAGLEALDLKLHVIPALDYDDGAKPNDAALADAVRGVLDESGFLAGETVLHIHNHSLGKNLSLPGAIGRLAAEGFHCLLQIHDFAEDMRPQNYRRMSAAAGNGQSPSAVLYPQASHIHYATLNSRDQNILAQAGITQERLHFLPNPVSDFGELPTREEARKQLREKFGIGEETQYYLYPVRAIRRKNVGELLLWSAALGEPATFGITLAPKNPKEQTAYRNWVQLADDLQLNCLFAVGAEGGLTFGENLSAADAIITTSVAEGFGMVFLEAWLANRNLLGRNLPQITTDFVNAGMKFPDLYERLVVPLDWAGKDEVRQSLLEAHASLLEDYGLANSTTLAESATAVDDLLAADSIDFAALNSDLQAKVIRHVNVDDAAKSQIVELNPAIRGTRGKLSDIDANANVVRQTYSLSHCGERLRHLYSELLKSPISPSIDSLRQGEKILRAFMSIEQLHPLRFET